MCPSRTNGKTLCIVVTGDLHGGHWHFVLNMDVGYVYHLIFRFRGWAFRSAVVLDNRPNQHLPRKCRDKPSYRAEMSSADT